MEESYPYLYTVLGLRSCADLCQRNQFGVLQNRKDAARRKTMLKEKRLFNDSEGPPPRSVNLSKIIFTD